MIPAPSWVLPRVFAHRCGGALAPENTLAGLRIAQALGFGAVEFDVMLSADGSPWLIHDEALERTTDGAAASPRSTATVCIARLTRSATRCLPRLLPPASPCCAGRSIRPKSPTRCSRAV